MYNNYRVSSCNRTVLDHVIPLTDRGRDRSERRCGRRGRREQGQGAEAEAVHRRQVHYETLQGNHLIGTVTTPKLENLLDFIHALFETNVNMC